MNKKFFAAFTAMVLSFSVVLVACTNKKNLEKYEETQVKMDTPMTLRAYGPSSKKAVQDAFKRIDEIEKLTSTTIEDSDVSKINKSAGEGFVKVDKDVFKIIKESIKYSKLSNGAYDITIGPIIKLWGIGTKDAKVPSQNEINQKKELVGYDKVKLNESEESVMLEKKGMSIDLGSIAKGYAADEAARIIKSYGIEKAIVNLGGSSIYLMGGKSENEPWTIGIQHPRKEGEGVYLCKLKAKDKILSTSGDYERYFMKSGKRYHHIMDPSTGAPADNGVTGVTIVLDRPDNFEEAMIADVLSTIVFVKGAEDGMNFIKAIDGADALIATSDNKLISTQGLKNKIGDISEEYKYVAQGR